MNRQITSFAYYTVGIVNIFTLWELSLSQNVKVKGSIYLCIKTGEDIPSSKSDGQRVMLMATVFL